MCEHGLSRNNYSKYIDSTNPTKRSTRNMKRKYLLVDDNNSADDTREETIKLGQRSSKKRKTEKAVLKRTAMMENYMKKKVESCKNLVSETSSEEEDEDLQIYSKRYLMSMIETLKEENRKLRADNSRLRASRIVEQDLPEMKKLSGDILRNLRETSLLIGLESSSRELPRCTINDDDRDVSSDSFRNQMNYPEPAQLLLSNRKRSATKDSTDTRNNSRELSPIEESSQSFADDRSSIVMKENCSAADFQNSSELQNFDEGIVVKSDPDGLQFAFEEQGVTKRGDLEPENGNLKNLLVDLGSGCIVDVDQLARCSRKHAAKMTCDLLSLVFTRDELATSSLTGKVPNTHKHLGISAKKPLNPSKIAAITAFVMKEFSGTPGTRNEILIAIKNKCNNAAKSVRKEQDKEKTANQTIV